MAKQHIGTLKNVIASAEIEGLSVSPLMESLCLKVLNDECSYQESFEIFKSQYEVSNAIQS